MLQQLYFLTFLSSFWHYISGSGLEGRARHTYYFGFCILKKQGACEKEERGRGWGKNKVSAAPLKGFLPHLCFLSWIYCHFILLFTVVTKYSTRSNLRKEGKGCSGSQFKKDTVPCSGKGMATEVGHLGPCTQWGSREWTGNGARLRILQTLPTDTLPFSF